MFCFCFLCVLFVMIFVLFCFVSFVLFCFGFFLEELLEIKITVSQSISCITVYIFIIYSCMWY